MTGPKCSLGQVALTTLGVSALMVCAGGCGQDAQDEFHPVWPLPPASPRLQHVKNVRIPADLAKPSVLDRIAQGITGEPPATMSRPHAVALEEGKRLYVTDQQMQALLVFDLNSPKAVVVKQAGDRFLASPVGVAFCGDVVAVSDSALKTVFLLTPKGEFQRTIDRPGGFKRPTGLAYDGRAKELYVVDTLANEVCVFSLASGAMTRRFGSQGVEHGEFNYPTHICLDRSGRIYVTDSMNFRVQAFDAKGKYLFQIGKHGDASGHLAVPKGVGVDTEGHIYIADSYFGTVQIFDRKGNFLLGIGQPGRGSGQFHIPTGVLVDSTNRVYVCDSYNSRIQILQYLGEPKDEIPPKSP